MTNKAQICCLCGDPARADDPITREHVPPKQFYPKSLREGLRKSLWTVPSHRSCNNKYKSDEEYFYHVLYLLVANLNPQSASIILGDLERRAMKPQSRALIQSIVRQAHNATESGIMFPPGTVRIDADKYRLQQVAIKIGRCLFYRDHNRFMPEDSCKDIRLCESEDDVPELYQHSWGSSKVNATELNPLGQNTIIVVEDAERGKPHSVSHQVFDYRTYYFEEARLHFYTLFFWSAFAFCMTFEEPDVY